MKRLNDLIEKLTTQARVKGANVQYDQYPDHIVAQLIPSLNGPVTFTNEEVDAPDADLDALIASKLG